MTSSPSWGSSRTWPNAPSGNLGLRGRAWQVGFYDHFLRADEQVERVVLYVLENPVRAGLVESWGDYQFSGSLVFDL